MTENLASLVKHYKNDIDIFVLGDGLGFGDIGANEIRKLVEEDTRIPLSFAFTGAELKKVYLEQFPEMAENVRRIPAITAAELKRTEQTIVGVFAKGPLEIFRSELKKYADVLAAASLMWIPEMKIETQVCMHLSGHVTWRGYYPDKICGTGYPFVKLFNLNFVNAEAETGGLDPAFSSPVFGIERGKGYGKTGFFQEFAAMVISDIANDDLDESLEYFEIILTSEGAAEFKNLNRRREKK